jgi:phage tail sheath protein FI
MAFQVSPGVNVSEIDLTTVVPSVSTTAGATVGKFQWGPVGKVRLISSESELVNVFGKPEANTAVSFLTAANFLSYGNNLQVVRAADADSNNSIISGEGNGISIRNEDEYDSAHIEDDADYSFVARYPGTIGDSLKVVFVSNTTFASSNYKSIFSSAPGTSVYANTYGSIDDQMHIAVIDANGSFSNGVKNTVLEKFEFVSKAPDAVSDDGSTTYYRNVIRNQSRYIYALGPGNVGAANWGDNATDSVTYGAGTEDANGANGIALTAGSYELPTSYSTSIDLFSNKEETDISLIVTGDADETDQGDWIDLASTRKDCIAFVSPQQDDVVNVADPLTNVKEWINSVNKFNSYAVADCNWKYQFDKYNNTYRWVPLNGDIAGLCVRTDLNNDPWFSPAGFNRGQIKNVVKLAWNPSQAQRDELYGAGVNPVVSVRGQGVLLYGDKTLLKQPSAFDRINVRRLFIVLEKAIANAARFSLFELNDETTRAQFVGLVEPFLRDVKGRRGITDFRVVCDATNNTPQVIDSNRFVGDIYIKPARSINYIQLNFIAVRSGVQFSEIAGSL